MKIRRNPLLRFLSMILFFVPRNLGEGILFFIGVIRILSFIHWFYICVTILLLVVILLSI